MEIVKKQIKRELEKNKVNIILNTNYVDKENNLNFVQLNFKITDCRKGFCFLGIFTDHFSNCYYDFPFCLKTLNWDLIKLLGDMFIQI